MRARMRRDGRDLERRRGRRADRRRHAAVRARRAVIAVPPALPARSSSSPPLPASHAAARPADGKGGSLIKADRHLRRAFWRADGLCGEALNDHGPVTITFDNTPPGGSPGALVGFVGGADAPGFAQLPEAERREAVLGCFEGSSGRGRSRPSATSSATGPRSEWSRGGPVANFAPGGSPSRAGAARARQARSTGPGRRTRPAGPATWTARSAPASAAAAAILAR